MGFVKLQREQIQVPELTDGTFIPAAAKSNALIAGTAGGAGERAGGGVAAVDDDVPIAGVSQVSHFIAELGFDKEQWEQIHIPGLLEGIFIPAAAKSNALKAGTAGGTGEGVGGAAVAADDGVPIAGVSQISHFNAELGFDKEQWEQIHIPGLWEGAFIPAAAKSNALTTGTPDSTCSFITVASKTGGVGVLFTPKMPDNCETLLLPTALNGLPPGPKVTGFGFGLAGSNPKENGVADLEGPDESSKFGSDDTGRPLTRLCILATTELGKIEVALDVMTKVGRELAVIVRAFALMSSTLVLLCSTFFPCSCGFGDPVGETSVDLNEKLKLEEGGSNLKSDFGRPGEGTGNTAGLGAGVDGAEVPSGWKLNLNLLGSLGIELNMLRDAVGLTLVGLVEVLEGDDPFSMTGMISFDCSFVFSLCSAASMSMSSNMSIVISGSEGILSTAVGVGLCPLMESLVRFADRRASSASSSSTSSTTYVILLISTIGASECERGLS